jgi:heme-degrading monooxygenase HmoA
MIRSGGVLFIDRYTRAFSSEVDPGSRKENASKQESSVDRPDVILSHQWWADDESLNRWRAHTQHRAIRRAGREQHFLDYRLRIGPAVVLW